MEVWYNLRNLEKKQAILNQYELLFKFAIQMRLKIAKKLNLFQT